MNQTEYIYGGLKITVRTPTEQEWLRGMKSEVHFADKKKDTGLSFKIVKVEDHPFHDRLSHRDLDAIERCVAEEIKKFRNNAKYRHLVDNVKDPLTNWEKQGLDKLGNKPLDEAAA